MLESEEKVCGCVAEAIRRLRSGGNPIVADERCSHMRWLNTYGARAASASQPSSSEFAQTVPTALADVLFAKTQAWCGRAAGKVTGMLLQFG